MEIAPYHIKVEDGKIINSEKKLIYGTLQNVYLKSSDSLNLQHQCSQCVHIVEL